ncbi:hypothetical protein HanIR_Chr15g0783281 [Helianthus annuus]|nr:hypothetical protein HanIR_Chr15g0783281 [Helianthus annuus]
MLPSLRQGTGNLGEMVYEKEGCAGVKQGKKKGKKRGVPIGLRCGRSLSPVGVNLR